VAADLLSKSMPEHFLILLQAITASPKALSLYESAMSLWLWVAVLYLVNMAIRGQDLRDVRSCFPCTMLNIVKL